MLSENINILQNIEFYILIFFTYSFAGWFFESIIGIFFVKKFINRGFLIGPYCPVYGCGVVLITLLLGKYKFDIFLIFILSILICGTLEYLTSYYMEKFFNARWWDYHNRKFNINGRICLETLIPFGVAGVVVLCFTNPFLINIFANLPSIFLNIICSFLVIVYIIDCIISFTIIFSFKDETYSKKDNTEEISNKVKDKTEEILMKAESEAIVLGRKVKLKSIKFRRKVKYTRKKLTNAIMYTPKELSEMIKARKEKLSNKILDSKDKLSYKISDSKDRLSYKISDSKYRLSNQIKLRKAEIEMKQKEFTYQIKESFKKQSTLRRRLMEAFPTLIVIPQINRKEKTEKKVAKGDKK